MREIYLDNNSTTKIDDKVLEIMQPYLTDVFGNPSSVHKKGIEAERAIKEARKTFADILNIKQKEVFFTSGATEAINTAIKGVAWAKQNKGRHIITSKGEHDAVLEACKWLQKQGFEITYLDITKDGSIKTKDVANAVRPDTILVSLMHVNNEIGTVYPINEYAAAVKEKNANTLFFSDGVQAFGKVNIDLSNVDLYAISGHKIHGPKGVGVLTKKEGINLEPLIHGGGQEAGLRSGTENVAGIAGFAKAVEIAYKDFNQKQKHFSQLKQKFTTMLKADFNDKEININSPESSVDTTLNAAFLGIPSEILLHALEEKGIYASAGSACSGKGQKISHVLEATGLSYEIATSTIRFGLSRQNTIKEIEQTCKVLKEIVPQLRKITQK